MHDKFDAEKWQWTEQDFERMVWHDCFLYAMAFPPNSFELLLDIDYIFKWVEPEEQDQPFKFWVAPVTLVFENVYDTVLEL